MNHRRNGLPETRKVTSMIRDQFWFGAAKASLWFNKAAWRVYSFSEKLRVACHNIWMHP